MTLRFLFIIGIAAAILAGCAKPPLAELETARYLVHHATEVGAADWSPGEYQLAQAALAAAEEQMARQQYRAAARTISLAQRYAEAARIESEQAVARLAELERQRAEKKARRQEEQRQRELAEEQAAQRQRELEQRRQQEAQQAAVRAASAANAANAANAAKPSPPPPAVEPVRVERYEVRAGQNLAEIASLPEVYGDMLLWPLIYRANRDQIKSPREIAPGQVFDIPRDKNSEELEAARREALELNLF